MGRGGGGIPLARVGVVADCRPSQVGRVGDRPQGDNWPGLGGRGGRKVPFCEDMIVI